MREIFPMGLPLLAAFATGIWGGDLVHAPTQGVGTVAILQPSIDQSVKWSKAYEDETYNILESLTRRIKPPEPRLVLWPEAAAPSYLLYERTAYQRVASMARKTRVPTLVGCLDAAGHPGKETVYYNAAYQFNGDSRIHGIYRKVHLVPFGEFVPWQKYLSFLGPVITDLGQLEGGREYVSLQADGFTYSPMICYEVIFPEEVREALQTGAQALVNISNDAWYGWTASPYQHAMMAVVRAAETHRPLLRASNAGISLTTDPFGKVLGASHLFERTLFTGGVILGPDSETLYMKWGSWLPKLCLILLVGAALWMWRKKALDGPAAGETTNPQRPTPV